MTLENKSKIEISGIRQMARDISVDEETPDESYRIRGNEMVCTRFVRGINLLDHHSWVPQSNAPVHHASRQNSMCQRWG